MVPGQRVRESSTMSKPSVRESWVRWVASGGQIRWHEAPSRRDRALLLIEAMVLRHLLTPLAGDEDERRTRTRTGRGDEGRQEGSMGSE